MQITLYINMYHLRSQFLHSTIVYSLEERVAKKGERGRRHGRRMGWEEGEETVLYKQQTCISEDLTNELYIVPDSQPI